MRKIAAILLCGIFLFNWVGYRLLDDYMEEAASHRLDAMLDYQQYDAGQLITIKVPMTRLAYYNNSEHFERSTGQVEVYGIPYRYVKRRIYNDTLEMLCIPNQNALQVRQAGGNYFKLVTDLNPQQDSNSRPTTHKTFTPDPFTCLEPVQIIAPGYIELLRGYPFSTPIASLSLPCDERPPAAFA